MIKISFWAKAAPTSSCTDMERFLGDYADQQSADYRRLWLKHQSNYGDQLESDDAPMLTYGVIAP